MLKLNKYSVSVGDKKIISNINYHFQKNKVYVLMGPNGSGKSSLAYSIAGHPSYKDGAVSTISLNNKNIKDVSADKRAKSGIFLSFQNPLSLNGITIFQLLRLALTGKKEPLALKLEIESVAKQLHIKKELLSRSLNDGASGGEKKKMELLQAIILDAKFIIFDEIDTGVDVDALKIIAKYMDKFRKEKTFLLITHYNRILKYIRPDKVLVLNDGEIVDEGNYQLAEKIESTGYKKYQK